MAEMPTVVFEPVVVKISTMELKPNQMLVLRFPMQVPEVEIRDLAKVLKTCIPEGYPVLLLREGIEITVVEKKNG